MPLIRTWPVALYVPSASRRKHEARSSSGPAWTAPSHPGSELGGGGPEPPSGGGSGTSSSGGLRLVYSNRVPVQRTKRILGGPAGQQFGSLPRNVFWRSTT